MAGVVLTLACYLAPWPASVSWLHGFAIVWAVVTTVGGWLAAAWFVRRYMTAEQADPRMHRLVSDWLCELEARLDSAAVTLARVPPALATGRSLVPDTRERVAAWLEAARCKDAVAQGLKGAGLEWVLATGYNELWGLLNHIEEALFAVNPKDMVIRDALYDEQRLEESTIEDRDVLLNKLRLAVQQLCPAAVKYLDKLPVLPAAEATRPPTANPGVDPRRGSHRASRTCDRASRTRG
jgi:hypothetical protein